MHVLPDRGLQPNFNELLRSKTVQVLKTQVELSVESQNSVGKFFYSTGIDLSAVNI